MSDLERAVLDRRSTRLFVRDRPAPRELVIEALELAIHAPSNSNIQPWRLVCGLAIGSPDRHFPANAVRVPRNPWDAIVRFVDELPSSPPAAGLAGQTDMGGRRGDRTPDHLLVREVLYR
jgi:hypothetical protein